MKLKELVEDAIMRHQSGAIEVALVDSSRGHSSFNLKKMILELSLSEEDFIFNSDKGIIHPISNKGWEILNNLFLTQEKEKEKVKNGEIRHSYWLKVNSQDASFSIANFRGTGVTASHDKERIARDKAQNELDRKFAGYGTPRWE